MLRQVQQILIQALLSADPCAALARGVAQATELSDEERNWLRQVDADGLRLTGLLVHKLRFEQLAQGDPDLARLLEEQPQEFARLFRAYHEAVSSTSFFPDEEAIQFRRWVSRSTPSTLQ